MDQRERTLRDWLAGYFPATEWRMEPASADASFRRYFRIFLAKRSLIVMDAPPELEDCRPFVDVAKRLHRVGVHVPAVLEQNLEEGYLLLSDLGSVSYFDILSGPSIASAYDDALETLALIQARTPTEGLPAYDRSRLMSELELFPEWFLARHLRRTLSAEERGSLDEIFAVLCQACLEQPQVFVHRDYHCRNLMLCKDQAFKGKRNPGVLDFQDAVSGPLMYDLVSLCRDVYVDWPQTTIEGWIDRFALGITHGSDYANIHLNDLRRWFRLTAAQRLLKVAGIFARLFHRDRKARYLGDLPLTLKHLFGVCAQEPELEVLGRLLKSWHLPHALDSARREQEAL